MDAQASVLIPFFVDKGRRMFTVGVKVRRNDDFEEIMKDIDDQTWRKIELYRFAYDLALNESDFNELRSTEERLDFLEKIALKIQEKVKND